MTDKEKIELIIQDKHLNNTQFCNEVCIAPGTLSHIRSGRTEPTLNILRSISQAFPDINPAWLFYGEGQMYKNQDSPTPDVNHVGAANLNAGATHINNVSDADVTDGAQLNLFALSGGSASPSSKNANGSYAAQPTASSTLSGASRHVANPAVQTSPLSVQEIVAETLKQQQKPARKVVEVRIFFDDGTFETFSAK